MSKATMFAVGLLMIAMLVGLGTSAEAPADPDDDWEMESKEKGVFLEDEGCPGVHPGWFDGTNVVRSHGGLHTCCGNCPPGGECYGEIRRI